MSADERSRAYVLHGKLPGLWGKLLGDFAPPVKELPPLSRAHIIGNPARAKGRGVIETLFTVNPVVEGEMEVWKWLDDLSLRLLPVGTYVVLVNDVGDVADLIMLARLNRGCTFIADIDFHGDPRVGFVLVHATLNRPNVKFRNPALISLQRRMVGLPPVAEDLGVVITAMGILIEACPHMAQALAGKRVEVTVTRDGYLNCMPPEADPYVFYLEKRQEPWARVEYQPRLLKRGEKE